MKSVRNALNRRAKGEKGFTLVEPSWRVVCGSVHD